MNTKTTDLIKTIISMVFQLITVLGLVTKGLYLVADMLEKFRTINNPPVQP